MAGVLVNFKLDRDSLLSLESVRPVDGFPLIITANATWTMDD
jgi:hypothetical protein